MELNVSLISEENKALDKKEWSFQGDASGCHVPKPDILPREEFMLVSEWGKKAPKDEQIFTGCGYIEMLDSPW